MDTLSFVADLVRALAWPVTTVVALSVFICVFRKPLTELISRITRISHNGTSIDIGQVRESAEQAADDVQPIEIDDRMQNAISNDPRAAVIEAWLRFEWEARTILEARGVVHTLRSPSHIIQELRNQELLTGNLAVVVADLRGIRNRAAHELQPYIDSEDARQYVEAVEFAIAILRSNAV